MRKKSVGEHKGNQHTRKMECAQNENIPKQQNRISYQSAEELGVGHSTVTRASQFTEGLDALSEVNKEAAEK